MGKLQINLLGTSFTIKADENTNHLEKLLKKYKELTDEIESKGILTEPLQISIMAGLMSVDQVLKEKEKKIRVAKSQGKTLFDDVETNEDIEAHRITNKIIENLDAILSEDEASAG